MVFPIFPTVIPVGRPALSSRRYPRIKGTITRSSVISLLSSIARFVLGYDPKNATQRVWLHRGSPRDELICFSRALVTASFHLRREAPRRRTNDVMNLIRGSDWPQPYARSSIYGSRAGRTGQVFARAKGNDRLRR